MPMPDTPAYSPDPRYAASARLSVAPMMDWTYNKNKTVKIKYLDELQRLM